MKSILSYKSTDFTEKWFFSIIISLEIIILFALILIAPKDLVYDERYYMETVPMVFEYGFSKEFFTNLGYHAGPMYAWVQVLFSPLTYLKPPGIRLVSLFFTCITMLSIGFILKMLKNPLLWKKAHYSSIIYFTKPFFTAKESEKKL